MYQPSWRTIGKRTSNEWIIDGRQRELSAFATWKDHERRNTCSFACDHGHWELGYKGDKPGRWTWKRQLHPRTRWVKVQYTCGPFFKLTLLILSREFTLWWSTITQGHQPCAPALPQQDIDENHWQWKHATRSQCGWYPSNIKDASSKTAWYHDPVSIIHNDEYNTKSDALIFFHRPAEQIPFKKITDITTNAGYQHQCDRSNTGEYSRWWEGYKLYTMIIKSIGVWNNTIGAGRKDDMGSTAFNYIVVYKFKFKYISNLHRSFWYQWGVVGKGKGDQQDFYDNNIGPNAYLYTHSYHRI